MGNSYEVVPPLPASAPRVPPNRFTRWLGRTVLRLGGWRLVGEFPDLPKMVIIAAPHSSNWDGIWGFAAKLALGLEIRVLGKAQLFRWPLGPLMRRLGVIPIDRSAPQGTVGQAAALIRASDRIWYALAPEGTRRRVERWKTGFWKIAHEAGVPILPAYFHYPERVIGLGPLFRTGDDMEADLAALREWYRPWQGRNRGTV
ncbi:1-acyl-sn-glycerol-3-phosphate acyltransferase [Luteimonas sp. J16]|jgi:1-acyl-sn-glycerol-3-phosphate acyltransferase|uniref:lysophospholipid acyltransferase family protein n=1 Tax=unclassified Luteimonas TaxID=2629088 RepID=UPI00047A5915|nr:MULTISPECIES: lysophospholipid acyltransferase family protein [unclassified Luteimonas]TWG89522.1 1-acyl-sn-glycerol-3-phosphate acyltransferase [Luteimonas sp. J16]